MAGTSGAVAVDPFNVSINSVSNRFVVVAVPGANGQKAFGTPPCQACRFANYQIFRTDDQPQNLSLYSLGNCLCEKRM